MTRAATAILCASCVLTTVSFAAELRPIEEVVAEENSASIIAYSLQRCAAAYATMSAFAQSAPDMKAMADQAMEMSATFFEVAVQLSREQGLSNTADGMTKVVVGMIDLYAEDMDKNYLATGNRLEGVLGRDLKYCKAMGE